MSTNDLPEDLVKAAGARALDYHAQNNPAELTKALSELSDSDRQALATGWREGKEANDRRAKSRKG